MSVILFYWKQKRCITEAVISTERYDVFAGKNICKLVFNGRVVGLKDWICTFFESGV